MNVEQGTGWHRETDSVLKVPPGGLVRVSQGGASKQIKSKTELATLVAGAVEAAVATTRVMPPFIEAHIRDGMGRNWDVSMPAPTPMHRKAIDSVRDLYDLR
jgi:hypothetical protein